MLNNFSCEPLGEFNSSQNQLFIYFISEAKNSNLKLCKPTIIAYTIVNR